MYVNSDATQRVRLGTGTVGETHSMITKRYPPADPKPDFAIIEKEVLDY